ncbi:hypothetical protein HHK36_024774 [Tetracentron sinense]|uniref:Carboxypeptidase n=1 Tax=Tetracentron sinense TaxID=13715 RepID=A0A834YJY5_TETSI|nr:hypothetical protein HHK36_024774 [Tetracentron sinense]
MAFWFFTAFSLILFFFSKSCAELITALPGQPTNVSFKQYSGYIVTDARHGRALFYYFIEADTADPLSRPLTLWLNGGPGCSSLGFGAFMEHGPFQPDENGLLVKNKYSWNLESNMLYLESPIGVGFSYTNTSSNYILWNDTRTAEDNLRFIVNWLEEFPKYKDSDLYLTGESYAGHYVPQLAALLLEHNKKPNITPIKLKAIAIGNPLLDLDISVIAADYLWSHGAISDDTLMLEKTVCNDSKYLREYVHSEWSQGCNDVFNRVADEIGDDIDRNDLLLPKCLSSSAAEQFKLKGKHGKIHSTILKLEFLTSQALLHILLKNDGFYTYSGDQDTKIPLTQTRIIANILANDLKLLPFTTYAPWYDKKQVGGWSQSFGGLREGKNVTYLTFATVRGAAHEVPFTSPSQALTLFRAFLSGSPLPRPHQD